MSAAPAPPLAAAAAPRPGAVIAIDGPAGVGKSTTARVLADRFGLLYVDSGAMYRALTWAALEASVAPADGPRLAVLLAKARLELRPGGGDARVFWDGREITAAIRSPAVEAAVSEVSAHAEVRAGMIERQRALGRDGGVVMEGRDIGSAVFPLADAKLYLDATLEARVQRRRRQQEGRGGALPCAEIAAEMARRDRLDSERSASPLAISPDAAVLDTSGWSASRQQEEAARAVLEMAAQQAPQPPAPGTRAAALRGKYRLAYNVLGALARFYGLRVHGRHHLDQPGGLIIAANHISWWDPPLAGATIRRGWVRTLAKAELFHPEPLGALFRFLDAIPIRRDRYDGNAFQAALDALAAGGDLFIFPEGTRRPVGEPGPVRSGLGTLMQRSTAPAVPLFVRGTRHLRPGGSPLAPLEVRFAAPVRLRALPALRARHDERAISQQIARLFEAIYREMQARSCAETPLTVWEQEDGRRQAQIYRRKAQRVFGRGGREAAAG